MIGGVPVIEVNTLKRIMEKQVKKYSSADALPGGYSFYKDKYTIEEMIYEGDNGFVYRAINNYSNQQVIIKELFPRGVIEYENAVLSFKRNKRTMAVEITEFSEKNFEIYHKLTERFLREIQHLKKMMNNTYVVKAQECFEAYNTAYIILDYVDYPTLGQLINSNEQVSAQEIFAIFTQLLKAVIALHSCGIIHRDLKPSNIYVLPDQIIIGDFGISKTESEIVRAKTIAYSEDFASPEQKTANQGQGYWSDVYSVGKIFEYLILSLGYQQEIQSQNQAFYAGLQQLHEFVDKDRIVEVLRRATQQRCQDRYQNIEALSQALIKKETDRTEGSKKRLSINKIGLRGILVGYTGVLVLGTIFIYSKLIEGQHIEMPVREAIKLEESINPIVDKQEDQIQQNQENQAIKEVEKTKETKENKEKIETEEVKEVEEKDPLTFLREEGITFKWDEPMELKWDNPYDMKNYPISITDTKLWHIKIPNVNVGDNGIDLKRFGLDPSDYYIMVFRPMDETRVGPFMRKLNFKIVEDETRQPLQPIELTYDQYVYRIDEREDIPYIVKPEADQYKATIMNIRNYEDYEEKLFDKPPLQFNDIVNRPGKYIMNLFYEKDGSSSLVCNNLITIPQPDQLPPLHFTRKANCTVTKAQGQEITWDPVEGAIKMEIKLSHIATGDVIEKILDGDATSVNVVDLGIVRGNYLIQASYYKDNKKSAYAGMYFVFIG